MGNKKNIEDIIRTGSEIKTKMGGSWSLTAGTVNKFDTKAVYIQVGAYAMIDVDENYSRIRFFEIVETRLRKEAYQVLSLLKHQYDRFILDFTYPNNDRYTVTKEYVSLELTLMCAGKQEYSELKKDFNMIGELMKEKLLTFPEFTWL